MIGAQSYFDAHEDEIEKLNFVMESDIGTFTPLGLEFAGTDDAACVVKEVLK